MIFGELYPIREVLTKMTVDETWNCGEYLGALLHPSGGDTTKAWKTWGMGWEEIALGKIRK